MTNLFFEQPIFNSPYEHPGKHWDLDDAGQPTQEVVEKRRRADFITPIPKPRKRRSAGGDQAALAFDEGKGLTTDEQAYDHTAIINALREQVDVWRRLPQSQWRVTPETAQLLEHSWRICERLGDIDCRDRVL